MTSANYATECVPFTSLAAANNAQNRFGNDFDDHVISIHFTGVLQVFTNITTGYTHDKLPIMHSEDYIAGVQ